MNFLSRCLTFFLLLVAALPSWSAALVDADQARQDFNPYAESYVSRMPVTEGRHDPAKLYSGVDRVSDYYRLLEDGYDMLGYSSFESGSVPPEKLKDYSARLNAELVLVYTRGIGNIANRGMVQEGGDNTRYEYFATYWVKLPLPLLGLHVQRENQAEDSGLEVLAVVKQSPAAASGLQRGDVVCRLGDVELHRPEQLLQAVQRYAGQSVDVYGRREGDDFKKTVTINPR